MDDKKVKNGERQKLSQMAFRGTDIKRTPCCSKRSLLETQNVSSADARGRERVKKP